MRKKRSPEFTEILPNRFWIKYQLDVEQKPQITLLQIEQQEQVDPKRKGTMICVTSQGNH